MKILSVIDGFFFALEGIVPTIPTALTTISAGGSMSIPSIILPTAMTNLGIPLTTGSAAMGFTIGFMKG